MIFNNKWKIGFLKIGLLLEYVIFIIFDNLGYFIFGEYLYIRFNEKNELIEFFVDLRFYKCLDNDDRFIILLMFIECKYR